jgi:hypothetical protein
MRLVERLCIKRMARTLLRRNQSLTQNQLRGFYLTHVVRSVDRLGSVQVVLPRPPKCIRELSTPIVC